MMVFDLSKPLSSRSRPAAPGAGRRGGAGWNPFPSGWFMWSTATHASFRSAHARQEVEMTAYILVDRREITDLEALGPYRHGLDQT
jgi:hypothetical protein